MHSLLSRKLLVPEHILVNRSGHTQDRDWNAARNILEKALSTVGHIGTNANGETDQYLGEETPLSLSSGGKRKPKEQYE